MPCDQVRKAQVNLELRADNLEYLKAALEALGYVVSVVKGVVTFYGHGVNGKFIDGKLRVEAYDSQAVENFDVNAVKREYSTQLVKSAAKRFGWNAQQKSATKFVVQKRRV